MHNLPAALLAHLEQEATALHKLTERLITACEATSHVGRGLPTLLRYRTVRHQSLMFNVRLIGPRMTLTSATVNPGTTFPSFAHSVLIHH